MTKEDALVVEALMALVRANIPTDVQELLTLGNPSRGIAPKALNNAIAAVIPLIERDLLREMLGWPGPVHFPVPPNEFFPVFKIAVKDFARSRGYDLDQGETDGGV